MTGSEALLRVHRTSYADRLELALLGELDNDTLPIAQDQVAAAEADAPPCLVLDLTQLEYVDSCGVRLVLLAQHGAGEAGRRLAVRLGHGRTRRMFDVLGITSRLEVLDAGETP
ncbi:STAS domain-containing protein [Actinomycetospora lemnae]|uniref:STAS domain-containing protein n=1 Tax=Actinomycetospora lemnae TaxID=3019891 RepID=A0ABT5T2C5_9PSEU|nr:STAS domain-containing protein [Actinomycetospora sp. DW7H6]MDD7969277.1 STAS domain-containing protein [Actinomycetospora sp. DW7H6]